MMIVAAHRTARSRRARAPTVRSASILKVQIVRIPKRSQNRIHALEHLKNARICPQRNMMEATRPENEVFADLAELCRSPGFVHVIAWFDFRDNLIRYGDQLDAEAMESQHAPDRLLRTEIATLIGLMVQSPVDGALPSPERFQGFIDRTQALLEELHKAMSAPWRDGFKVLDGIATMETPLWTGAGLREPIFYSGESAYGFQYRALAIKKYAADNPWLLANKGFEIEDAVSVARILADILSERQMVLSRTLTERPPETWTMLPGSVFSADEIKARCAIAPARIDAVLAAFTLPRGNLNPRFTALHEFNATNATPILHWDDGQFLLLQHYSLLEALYESPAFWVTDDKAYRPTALGHRGAFTETFAAECLEKVFGQARVLRNIDIYGPDRNRMGEIDVLAVFGRRAIVVQAKSKRLTLEARKGNDLQLKDDFRKAVQDAADQAFRCAAALLDPACRLKTTDQAPLDLSRDFDLVQPLCILSDHYPALAFQARQFLDPQTTDRIMAPMVMDVFALDVMAEMLASPLQFLHYLTLRERFGDRLLAGHELTLLGFHLTHHLWFDDDYNMVTLGDDFSIPLDIAMLARREGIPGAETPPGILTKLRDTTFGSLLRQIEDSDDPDVGELGLLLLELGEETARSLGSGVDTLCAAAQRDRRVHDLSLAFGEAQAGLTVHCRYPDAPDTMTRLLGHCQLRKYATRSNSWYGLLIDPDSRTIIASLGSRDPWAFNAEVDRLARRWPLRPQVPWAAIEGRVGRTSAGRNDPCPCGSGSGKKHKKCCLARP
nr:NERD domain-containing protein [Brevundimonas sp.]